MSDNTQGNWFDNSTPDPSQPGPAAVPPAQQWAPPTQPPSYAAPPQQPPTYVAPPQQAVPTEPWGAPGVGLPAPSPNAGMQPMSETVDFGANSVEKKGGMAGRVAVVGLSLALISGGAIAVRSATSDPAGPASADDAAAAVFAALEDEDFVGVVELMAPAEREAYVEPMLDIVQEVGRLADRPVGDNFFADLPFEIEIEGLDYEITQLGPGVSWVDVTAGQLDVTFVADEIPAWADGVEDALGTAEDVTESIDLADEDVEFALVEDDGAWYWSAGYTAAEAIREDMGQPLPLFNGTELADGADTPEGAVQEAVDGLIDFDLTEAFTKLDPEEFGVLYDYSDLFLDDAAREFAAIENEIPADFDYSVGGFEYSSHEVRGRTVVTVDAFEFSGSDGLESISGSYADGCLVINVSGEAMNTCDVQDQALDELPAEFADLQGQLLDIQERMADRQSGITVVERDGKWYISGGPTFFGAIGDVLEVMTPDDVDELADVFSDLTGFVGLSAEESFIDIADEIDGSTEVDDHGVFDNGAPAEDGEDFNEDDWEVLDDSEQFGFDEDYDRVDPSFIVSGYEIWDQEASGSVLPAWFETEVPLTVTNLADETTWVEVAEFASAEIQGPVAAAVVASIYDCGLVESDLPEGATLYICTDSTVVVTYGRWVLTSYGSEVDPLSPIFAAQVAHLKSLGE